MTRPEREAVDAAGALFSAHGWEWVVERRKRHVTLIVTPPGACALNMIVTAPRAGTGAFIAVAHAKRLLNQHGIRCTS